MTRTLGSDSTFKETGVKVHFLNCRSNCLILFQMFFLICFLIVFVILFLTFFSNSLSNCLTLSPRCSVSAPPLQTLPF